MPHSHRHVADWTPERLKAWAAKTGPATAELVEKIIASRAHPQQAYRACLGILRLGDAYGNERLEAAAARALAIGAYSYRSMVSILKQGLDSRLLPEASEGTHVVRHANIRGRTYYAESQPHEVSNQVPSPFNHLTS
jgi:transposase